MIKKIFSLFLLLFFSFVANSQNEEDTTIKLYYLMATSPWDITTDIFESTFIDSKYCKSVVLNKKSDVSVFLLELENLQDTIIDRNKSYKENVDASICKQPQNSMQPPMDTRGKMIIMTPNGNKVFYYSLNVIWNSTDNRLYKMNDKLRTIIISKFFP